MVVLDCNFDADAHRGQFWCLQSTRVYCSGRKKQVSLHRGICTCPKSTQVTSDAYLTGCILGIRLQLMTFHKHARTKRGQLFTCSTTHNLRANLAPPTSARAPDCFNNSQSLPFGGGLLTCLICGPVAITHPDKVVWEESPASAQFALPPSSVIPPYVHDDVPHRQAQLIVLLSLIVKLHHGLHWGGGQKNT